MSEQTNPNTASGTSPPASPAPKPTPPPATDLESPPSDTAKAVAMVASGTYSCLAITGRGGLGKSTAVQDAFDNHPNRANLDIDYFTGKSPTELYALLYERRLSAQITVLEDIEALLSQAQVVRILRAALWGPKHPKTKAMIRTVDWGSKTIAKMKDAAGNPIPNKFVYEGRLVFSIHDMPGRDAPPLALNT